MGPRPFSPVISVVSATNAKIPLSSRLKVAPPNRTLGSTLERSALSSTRANATRHLLETRPRNPRSVPSGVRSPALMEVLELSSQVHIQSPCCRYGTPRPHYAVSFQHLKRVAYHMACNK